MQHVVLWERVLTYFQGKALGDASTWIIFLKKFTLFYRKNENRYENYLKEIKLIFIWFIILAKKIINLKLCTFYFILWNVYYTTINMEDINIIVYYYE